MSHLCKPQNINECMCIILHELSSQACYVLWKTWLSLKTPQMMTMAFSITDSRKKQDVSESKYQKNIIYIYTWMSIQTFIKLFNLIMSSDHNGWNSIKTHTNFALWWQHYNDFFTYKCNICAICELLKFIRVNGFFRTVIIVPKASIVT